MEFHCPICESTSIRTGLSSHSENEEYEGECFECECNWLTEFQETCEAVKIRIVNLGKGPQLPFEREPFRSVSLGWILKIIGLIYWIGIAVNYGFGLLQAVCMIPSPLLIRWGHRLSQPIHRFESNNGAQDSILYLRQFSDDMRITLQPPGIVATLAGVRGDLSDLLFVKSNSVREFASENLIAFFPLRIIRAFLGFATDSCDESLTNAFKKHGKVVAIGKPSEKMASPGASKTYVSDETWKAIVNFELQRSRFIIIQPGSSDGIFWELNQIKRTVPPKKVLFCMAGFWREADLFEKFRFLLSEKNGIILPEEIPYLSRPSFVYFDSNWTPVLQPLSYKCPLLWPILSDATDVTYTIENFIKSSAQENTLDPVPVK